VVRCAVLGNRGAIALGAVGGWTAWQSCGTGSAHVDVWLAIVAGPSKSTSMPSHGLRRAST
jgi:hypothetical protein